LPTELNPRIGAGINVIARSVPGLPLVLLALAAQAGDGLDFRPQELEELVTSCADANRAGGGWVAAPGRRAETTSLPLVEMDGGYRVAGAGEPTHAEILVGPSDVGSFVRFSPDPARIKPGAPIAPRVVRAFELADQLAGTKIGTLVAAREARG